MSQGNSDQKLPMSETLNDWLTNRFGTERQLDGLAIPATVVSTDETGTIATVNLEIEDDILNTIPQVTCPVATSEYVRLPLQKGDPGYVIPSDFYLGGVSGLGGGKATFTQLPNLSTLAFHPLGNTNLDPDDDKQKVLVYGPTGVILRDKEKNCIWTLTPDGIQITLFGQPYMTFARNGITLTYGGNSITLSNSGVEIVGVSGPVSVTAPSGVLLDGGGPGTTIDGKDFLPHTHTGVSTGGDTSGPVS